MLGLGLGSHKAKAFRSIVAKLYGKLRHRSTYFENNKEGAKDIKDYKLLDKATILLTPTATSDARVNSVKTYTGDELITNGGFDADSNWTLGSEWSISDGKLKGLGAGAFSFASQTISGITNKTLRLTFEILDYVSGTFRVNPAHRADGADIRYSGNGTYEVIYKAANGSFRFQMQEFEGSIDNVSIVDVSSDFDFDRASSATRINSSGLVQDMQSITDPELVLNGNFEELGDELIDNSNWAVNSPVTNDNGLLTFSGVSGTYAKQDILTTGKSYKVTFDVLASSGDLTIFAGAANSVYDATVTPNSTVTIYVTDGGVDDKIYFGNDFTGQIQNVSVQQVNVDSEGNDIWNLNATGDSSALITDKLTLNCDDGDFASAAQSYSFVDGNTYKLSFDLTGDNQSKSFTFRDNSSALGGFTEDISLDFEGTETKTFIFTANTNSDAIYIKRNSAGTYSWSIDNVSLKDITFSTDVDLARINYDSNGENGHILLEPTSSNLVPYSENFEGGSWTNESIGTTPTLEGGYTAPDGSNSAYKISNANQDSFWYYPSVADSDDSRTIWARTVSGTGTAQLTSHNSNTNNTFNLTETWQRFEVNGTTSGTGSTSFYAVDFRGSGTLTELLVWGAQLEALSYATSYIPTLTGSTVTRATETLLGSGNSTLINSTEGVLYAEIAALADDGTYRILSLSDGTTNERVYMQYTNASNTVSVVVKDGGVTQANMVYVLSDATNFSKVAIKYKANDFALWVDGVERGTDTSGNTPTGLNTLDFNNASSTVFYGKVKALAVFNEALSDDELELLTGVTNYPSFGALAAAGGYTII